MSTLLHDERIPAALLTIVMHITVVSAIAMVAASLARRHAAFRHTILCTAMLCLLASPLFCAFGAWSGLSMEIPLAVNPGQSTNGMSKVDTASSSQAVARSFEGAQSLPAASPSPTRDLGTRNADTTAAVIAHKPRLGLAHTICITLGSVWLLGTIVFWGGILCSLWKAVALLRSAEPISTDAYRSEIREAMAVLGLAEFPPVAVSSRILFPAVLGIFGRPWIVVPPRLLATVSPTERVHILVHEGAHAVRRDPMALLLQNVCGALFWWHPLVRAVIQSLDAAREELCDNYVLQNAEPEAYGDTLLRMAILQRRTTPSITLAGSLNARLRLEERIAGILDPRRKTMTRTSLLAASVVLSTFVVLSILLNVRFVSAQGQEKNTPSDRQENSLAVSAAATAAEGQAPSGQEDAAESRVPGQVRPWSLKLVAADSVTGSSIPSPEFDVRLAQNQHLFGRGSEDGGWTVEIPSRTPRFCSIRVTADGYTPMRASWSNRDNQPLDRLPAMLSFPMTKGIEVGGTVVDEDGKPVPGATVRFSASSEAYNRGRRLEQSFGGEIYKTDEGGRWVCPIAPKDIDSGSISASHPDYAQDATTYSVDHQIEELRQFKHEFKLSKGFVLQGRVVDWDGRPIEGAVLGVGELNVYRDKGPFATTGADGRYAFPPLARMNPFRSDESWPVTVTAVKRGYAPVMQAVPDSSAKQLRKLPSRERVVDFLLRKGEKVTLLVTDSDGLPLEGVWVILVNWRDTDALRALRQFGIPEETDSQGKWQWTWAPAEEIGYNVLMSGFMSILNQPIRPTDALVHLTLKRPQVISGKVVDAQTKERIEAFIVQKGWPGFRDGIRWDSMRTQGIDGEYRKQITMPAKAYHYRVTAEGYEPKISELTPVTEGPTKVDFELTRSK